MKRSAILSLMFIAGMLAVPGVLNAQVEKRVEVSKAYVPSVEHATKLAVRPNMVDTAAIQPEIDYSITPLTLETQLATRPIRPATITYWEFDRPLPFYLKAGAGYPLNSALDLYVSTQNPDIGYALGYINHDGRYGRIPYTPDGDHSALWMDNRVGVAAGKYIGRHVLEGEVSYRNRIIDRYGLFPDPDFPTFDNGNRRVIGDLQGKIRIGDDFNDLSRTNFNVEVTAGNWWNPLDSKLYLEDNVVPVLDYPYENEWNLGVDAAVGRRFAIRSSSGPDSRAGGVATARANRFGPLLLTITTGPIRERSVMPIVPGRSIWSSVWITTGTMWRGAMRRIISFPTLTCVSIWAAAVSYLMSSWTEP